MARETYMGEKPPSWIDMETERPLGFRPDPMPALPDDIAILYPHDGQELPVMNSLPYLWKMPGSGTRYDRGDAWEQGNKQRLKHAEYS
eukprot:NODE_2040_length_463_cov_1132.915459_g1961_i0.p2 GENE.NODE_2040_length_463_cov_1132.915459_g1961_i0~~NODE_2040_length_463_cov_1132.915459_g1961_i0.p2  ORF type:complete len:88 (+),score=13.98 NODE_2040_length_463_cov_1132.915459_g1961_i0:61-324(+)